MCIVDSVCFEIGSQSELTSQTMNNFFKQKIIQAHLLYVSTTKLLGNHSGNFLKMFIDEDFVKICRNFFSKA